MTRFAPPLVSSVVAAEKMRYLFCGRVTSECNDHVFQCVLLLASTDLVTASSVADALSDAVLMNQFSYRRGCRFFGWKKKNRLMF
jgi:hypothetical protein